MLGCLQQYTRHRDDDDAAGMRNQRDDGLCLSKPAEVRTATHCNPVGQVQRSH